MDIKNIPDKDVRIIQDVADHIARRTFIDGISEEDLKQELTIIGMEQYARSWDESKQKVNRIKMRNRNGEVQSKRDSNLRVYMRNLMKNRTHNIERGLNTKKRGGGVTVTSIDPQSLMFDAMFNGKEGNTIDLDTNSFETIGLTEEQVKVVAYIAGNDLGVGGKKGSTKKTMAEDTGLTLERIGEVMNDLKGNANLRELLWNRV